MQDLQSFVHIGGRIPQSTPKATCYGQRLSSSDRKAAECRTFHAPVLHALALLTQLGLKPDFDSTTPLAKTHTLCSFRIAAQEPDQRATSWSVVESVRRVAVLTWSSAARSYIPSYKEVPLPTSETMSSSSGSSSCKTSSGRCTFCGEYMGNTSVPIVGYGSPSTEGKGAFTKLKPLRWRFLSNKAPRTKYMCGACAEKRKVPQQFDQQLLSLDSSCSDGARDPDMLHKREDRNSKQQVSGQALKLEHLQEPRSKRQQRKTQLKQENVRVQSEKREKPQHPEHRERQDSTQEQRRSDSRRKGSSQTSDPTPRSSRGNVLHPFSNHRASKESIMRNRPVSAAEIDTRTSIMKPRAASVDTPSRARRPSSGQPEPRRSEKKESRRSQTDPRLSSTADILGMSRSIELPPNYFAMSTTSPTFTAMSAPDPDPLALQHLEMQLPQLEPRKQNETEEERQRRRSASYAHMLMRMRRHYDAVQVNAPQGHPATAPPRRVRADRRAKSVAVRNVKDDPVGDNPAGLAVDLAYLRAYKDAR